MAQTVDGILKEVIMAHPVSCLWVSPPTDLVARIERCIDSAREQVTSQGPGHLFFRADDVAVQGERFARLMELFTRHDVPLSLAVVPAWLTRPRWQQLKILHDKAPHLWCWHQHGWQHKNHESRGKKQEFGEARSSSRIRQDLIRGRHRLETLLGSAFYPVFTPPWNRCGLGTLTLLKELDYYAVSRTQGSLPLPPEELEDFAVNVDLHTRKERDPEISWEALFAELGGALSSGFCGIMIHHQRMNEAAFSFLEILLSALSRSRDCSLVHFRDLVQLRKQTIERTGH
jgi:hypothetical protein